MKEIYRRVLISAIYMLICLFCFAETKRVYNVYDGTVCDTILIIPEENNIRSRDIEVCFSFPGKNEGFFNGHRSISIKWNYGNENLLGSVTFEPGSDTMDDMLDSRYMKVTIHTPEGGEETFKLKKDIGLGKEENVALVSLLPGKVKLGLGHRQPAVFYEVETECKPNDASAVFVNGNINVPILMWESTEDVSSKLRTDLTEESIRAQVVNGDAGNKICGIWNYLDRKTDDHYARAGGRYKLGIVEKEVDRDSYYLIYLGGGEVNRQEWKEGMIKGELRSTPFENHYDLVWYDSKMEKIDSDCHADISEEGILTLNFPLMKSSLRFYRE